MRAEGTCFSMNVAETCAAADCFQAEGARAGE